jgi:hypothetical protein
MDYRHSYEYNHHKLSAAQKRFIRKWEKLRTWNKWRYCIMEGAFKEGLLLFFIVKILELVFDFSNAFKYYNSAQGVLRLLANLIFWMAIGMAFAWWKRQTYEEEYQVLKKMDK